MGQEEPGKDGETSTTAGAPGDTDPGTMASARRMYEYWVEESGLGRLDCSAPGRPTSDQGPPAWGVLFF